MNIVILGGSGFIGRHLVRNLLTDNNRITIFGHQAAHLQDSRIRYVDRNFSAKTDFQLIVEEADVVIHLISTSVPGNESVALDEVERNVIPSMKLFQACAACGVSKVVFVSSGGTIYGDSGERLSKETDLPDPINTYGLQKLMIEDSLRYASKNGDFDYQILRLSNPYGPGQNPNGPLGLITKLVYQAMNGETISIFGDGSVVRDFIYIEDAIQCIMDILNNGKNNETYNIGRGVGASVSEVVETIRQVLPVGVHVQYQPSRKVDVPYSVLDITKYRSFGSVHDFVTLGDGIRRTYDFFMKGRS